MAETTPTADKKSNGASSKSYRNEEAWTTWPGFPRAAKTLGVSMKRLREMVTFGEIESFKAEDGTIRFRPQWLEEYIKDRDGIPDDEDERSSDQQASRHGIPAEAIRATGDLLRASQLQNLELHRLVLQGFKAATEAQDVTIQRLLMRQEQYEAIITDLLKAREQYFDAQLEREVMRNQHVAAQKRRDELFEVSKGWAGELIEGLKQKYGLTSEAGAKVRAAIELLKALSPDQVEVGAMMGFFTEEQIQLIEQILGRPIPRPKKDEPKPNTASAGAADSSSSAPPASGGAGDSQSSAPPETETQPAPAGETAGTPAQPNETESSNA